MFRPGDDVDLSSERGTTMGAVDDKGQKASKEKLSKELSKEIMEREKKLEHTIPLDIKPYKEPMLLKVCHTTTLVLLVLSFVLMALTVIQFVDIFVWLPLLMGEKD
ncbi:hypothetical protein OESDEN_03926 [Oesophagostomum dentatum]|uniref:Uncharacterized protein n=1 Tax=Oesophagostomum dentatum TaxID=61180 RepID=A0A0B1TJ64_OESDE|nr:hypothetical protein OESDEN_03926 [Oesophagostomum dentatum]